VANTLKITLIKSTIGAKPKHVRTIQALGLKRIRHTVEKQDNPQMRGMIFQVKHLISVVE
jgi:large subunit ribosomal protein L30